MEKFTFLGKKVAMSAFLCCFSLTGFAQEDTQTFDFDDNETKEYAAFFKQPSAIEGKCNAEVMGIDINREGFSWDDMNTWKNSEGKIWLSYSDGYVERKRRLGVYIKRSVTTGRREPHRPLQTF